MSCDRTRTQLKALADGELGLISALRTRLHAAACAACRTELADVRRVSHQIIALVQLSTPGPVRQRILHAASVAATTVGPERRSGSSIPVPVPMPANARARRRYLPRIAGVAIPAAICAALVAFFLYRQSPAAALDRIRAAAGNVRSVHQVGWLMERGDKPIRHIMWYADGKFRNEEEGGNISVYDGRHVHIYDPHENVLFKNVSDKPGGGVAFRGFTVEALLEMEGGAHVSLDRNATWEGRAAMRFTIEHPHLGERYIVWADPDTHLPMAVKIYVRFGSKWKLMGASELMDYNVPVPEGIFTLDVPRDARVIDKETVGREWWARYKKGVASQKVGDLTVTIKDFQVCREGDVFVIYTPKYNGDVHLSDDLCTEYLSIGQSFQPWTDGGLWFTPVKPPTERPSRYVLQAEVEQRGKPSLRVTLTVADPFYSPLACPLYPNFPRELGKAAFIYPWIDGIVVARLERRAGYYWKKVGDLQAAADQYEAMIAQADRLFQRRYFQPHTWQSVGQLYEELGDADKAREAYKRGLESIRSGPGYQGYDEWFREALRRLEGKGK